MRLDQLNRRHFITLLGGAAVATPHTAHAPRVGKQSRNGNFEMCGLSIQFQSICAPHRYDRSNMIIGTNEHDRVGLQSRTDSKAIADVEVGTLAQAAIERSVPTRNDGVPQSGCIMRDRRSPPHIGEIKR
jgi:hypothetical protein